MSVPADPARATVRRLWRYPVKSLVGEELDAADVDSRGLCGDRSWALREPDGKLGSGKSSSRFRRMDGLLALRASYDGEVPVVAFPDGREVRGDDEAVHAALSAYVGRPVSLAREGDVPHHDDGPVHLVTTASLRWAERIHGRPVDPRRLRPNLLLELGPGGEGEHDGLPEQDWLGRRMSVGADVVLEVVDPMPRCVMVDLDQRGMPVEGGLLKDLTDHNDGCLGVLARVVRPGRLRVGDSAALQD